MKKIWFVMLGDKHGRSLPWVLTDRRGRMRTFRTELDAAWTGSRQGFPHWEAYELVWNREDGQ